MQNNKSNSKKVFHVQKNSACPIDLNPVNNLMRRFKSQDIYTLSPQHKPEIIQKKMTNPKEKYFKNYNQLSGWNNSKSSTNNLSITNSKAAMLSPKKHLDYSDKRVKTLSPNSMTQSCEQLKQNKTTKKQQKELGQRFVLPMRNILNDESIQELDTEENLISLEDENQTCENNQFTSSTGFLTSKESRPFHRESNSKRNLRAVDEKSIEKVSINLNSSNNNSKKKSREYHMNLGAIGKNKNIHISIEENDILYESNKPNEVVMREFLQIARKGDKEAFLDVFETVINENQQLINYQDDQGFTALHYSSNEGNLKIVEILIKGNADVNIKSKNKRTPLHLSSHQGYFDISKCLIENGAIINCQDNERNTPIHFCVISQHIELLKYLLVRCPQADARNIYGKTPFDLATNDEIKLLLTDYLKKNESQYHKIRIHTAHNSQAISMFNHLKNTTTSSPTKQSHKINEFTPKSIAHKSKLIGMNPTISKKRFNQNNTTNNQVQNNNININISTNLCNVVNIEQDHQTKKYTTTTSTTATAIKEKEIGRVNSTLNSTKANNKVINSYTKKHNLKQLTSPTKNVNQFLTSKSNSKGQFEIVKNKKKPMSIMTSSNSYNNNQTTQCEIKIANVEINLNENLTEQTYPNNPTEIDEKIYIKEYHDNDNNTSTNNLSTNQNNSVSVEDEKISPSMFIIKGLLGKGSFGEVYLVEKKNSPTLYAMKVLNKDFIMSQNIVKYAMTERNILSLTSHPFIVKLSYAFQTTDQLFLILEYCPGGDLSKHLAIEKRFTEERAKIYLCEIILALGDLHKRDIIFRDLKPDNVVLDKDGHALLTDFGLSKEGVFDGKNTKSFCGSVAYLAPEMLKRKGHGKSVDWYLLGVLFYEMLVGIPPFFTNSKEQIFRNIEKAELQIPKYVSPEAKCLLQDLLNRNTFQRLGSTNDVEQIMEHQYFNDINWNDVYERKLNPPKPKLDIFVQNFSKPKVFPTKKEEEEEDNQKNNHTQANSKSHFDGWSFINNESNNKCENTTTQGSS